jgi:hypothetical protein
MVEATVTMPCDAPCCGGSSSSSSSSSKSTSIPPATCPCLPCNQSCESTSCEATISGAAGSITVSCDLATTAALPSTAVGCCGLSANVDQYCPGRPDGTHYFIYVNAGGSPVTNPAFADQSFRFNVRLLVSNNSNLPYDEVWHISVTGFDCSGGNLHFSIGTSGPVGPCSGTPLSNPTGLSVSYGGPYYLDDPSHRELCCPNSNAHCLEHGSTYSVDMGTWSDRGVCTDCAGISGVHTMTNPKPRDGSSGFLGGGYEDDCGWWTPNMRLCNQTGRFYLIVRSSVGTYTYNLTWINDSGGIIQWLGSAATCGGAQLTMNGSIGSCNYPQFVYIS